MAFTRSPLFQYPLLLLVCGVMAAPPLVNHFRAEVPFGWPVFADTPPHHELPTAISKNKDYPLWYFVGRTVVEDATLRERTGANWPLYPTDPDQTFPFMYPPFAAVCLGAFSLLGPTGMLVALILLNVLSVGVAIELSVRMVAGTGNVSVWLRVIPAAICLFFLNDMFLLGQPNLGLLCLVLGGLMLTRSDKPTNQILGGGLFALATAIKAFPAVVIVYLLWRRQWLAALSMVGFCVLFFVAVPVVVRGGDRSMGELKTWANGMLFRQGEKGHGQRPEQSVGFRNQSLFGVANRLLRPGNAKAEETASGGAEPLYVNVVDLSYRGAMIGAMTVAGLLGLGFVLVMPRKANSPLEARLLTRLGLAGVALQPERSCQTRDTDAAEFGMLVILMTIGTPYAFGYYFVWLLFPLTVIVHHGLKGDRIAWGAVLGVAALFAASGLVAFKWYEPMAYGSLFWAAVVALAGCGWVMVRSRRAIPEPHPPFPSP